MDPLTRSEASRINGAKSRGPKTPEGKRISAANAALSTGPVTPEGKARVSRNATTHGMLSASLVLDRECAESFAELQAVLEEEFQPEPGVEARLVGVMAAAHWRQMRAWAVEKIQLNEETRRQELAHPADPAASAVDQPAMATAHAFHALSETRALDVQRRYEICFDRQYYRALACLKAHRAWKEAQRARQEPEKHVFSKQTEPEPKPVNPAPNPANPAPNPVNQ